MEKVIEVAVSSEKIHKNNVVIQVIEKPTYYLKQDDSRFFGLGTILFAIINGFGNSTNSYKLIRVECNKQDFNDFVPTKDCQSKYWLTESGIRQTAFGIMSGREYEFKEISENEFNEKRIKLLNHYLEE